MSYLQSKNNVGFRTPYIFIRDPYHRDWSLHLHLLRIEPQDITGRRGIDGVCTEQ